MRNKKVILISLLMAICVLSVFGEQYTTDTATFVVKAYKSTPSAGGDPKQSTLLSVYDALTGTLNEVGKPKPGEEQIAGKSSVINVLPYLDKFLTTGGAIVDTKDQVLFSYVVTGCTEGNFSLTVNLNDFKGVYDVVGNVYTESAGGLNDTIATYYELINVSFLFPSVHSAKTATHNIKLTSLTPDANTVKRASTFTINWSIGKNNQSTTEALNDTWVAEGVFLMALDKDSYKKAHTGGYKANVIVTLSSV